MSLLKFIWDNTYGLLVDDGSLAAGALLALLASGSVSILAPSAAIRNLGGFLLLGLVCALLILNLYAAGRNAARTRLK